MITVVKAHGKPWWRFNEVANGDRVSFDAGEPHQNNDIGVVYGRENRNKHSLNSELRSKRWDPVLSKIEEHKNEA